MDERLANLLAQQHSIVTWSQMRELDLTEREIKQLARGDVIRRVHPRTYALTGARRSWKQRLVAAVLAAGDGAVGSHASAARLWSFAVQPEDAIEITVPGDPPRLANVRVHRSTKLVDEDVIRAKTIPRTSFERTLCDCSALLSEFQLSRTFDDGLRRNVASLPRLTACAERLESGPGRHMSVIRKLLADRGFGYNPGGSRSELHVLDVLRKARFPLPVQQFEVVVAGNTFRLDFSYPDLKIFIEYYGLAFHTGASAVPHDSDRISDLAGAGWLPLIFTEKSTDADIVRRTAVAFHERGVVGPTDT